MGKEPLCQTTDASQHVYCGEMSFLGQGPVQYNMAVQNRAQGVGDRVFHIITLDQNSVNPGYGCRCRIYRTFQKVLGSRLNTLGVYPLEVGGSPAASPISLAAMASRVAESIMKSTSLPKSLKNSDIAQARLAPRMRTVAG